MDNHNRSKKHAENVSRLVLEFGDDDDGDDNRDDENKDDNGDTLNADDADDVELADDLLAFTQSR